MAEQKRWWRPVPSDQVDEVAGARRDVHDERAGHPGRRAAGGDLEAQLAAAGAVAPTQGEEVRKLGVESSGTAGVVLVLALVVPVEGGALEL
eukprot:scaffold4550_cov128-Isochrysis_galbana.AAC.4